MDQITVYQLTPAGLYAGEAVADASPLEPGVYLLPAGCISTAPPDAWPAGQWPRWNGTVWELVVKPVPHIVDPTEKLAAFLADNPDVAALIAARSAN